MACTPGRIGSYTMVLIFAFGPSRVHETMQARPVFLVAY